VASRQANRKTIVSRRLPGSPAQLTGIARDGHDGPRQFDADVATGVQVADPAAFGEVVDFDVARGNAKPRPRLNRLAQRNFFAESLGNPN
jgi:hypothetical protein